MTTPSRRPRVRLQPRVDPELAQRLAAYSAALGASENAVMEEALRQHLDRTSDRTLLLRRLDRLGRELRRTQRDLEVLSEAFATWTKLWFAHTPTIPEDGKRAARMTAESRYKQFVNHVAQQLSAGKRFLDDLPREEVADDAELAELVNET